MKVMYSLVLVVDCLLDAQDFAFIDFHGKSNSCVYALCFFLELLYYYLSFLAPIFIE
jgi:hypothetical protein